MEKLIIKKQIIFRNIARILRALDLSFMKIVLSKVKYFIAGLFIITAISIVLIAFMSGDLKHDGQDFSADIRQDGDLIRSTFEAKGAGIGFSIAAPHAEKSTDGKATVYKVDENTSLKYEVLEEGAVQGLKETIILNSKTASNEYAFELNLEGVKEYHPDPETHQWHFYNDKGEEAFYIPAGFMVDAKGVRSEAVNIGISHENEKLTAKVTADREWLDAPERTYPIHIDPSVIVAASSGRTNTAITTSGIASTDIQFGGLQRKIVKASGAWYAFYADDNTGQDVFYKKCLEATLCDSASDWSSRVDIDTTDADNYNPSIWLESNTIYVAWIDDSTDSIEVNTINTANADALGTKCSSADQGTIGSTFMVSIAVADNGSVYLAYSDTSTDTEYGAFDLTYSGCTFTDIITTVQTETLRPNAAGDATATTVSGCVSNYDCVNESSHDSDTTFVRNNSSGTAQVDNYNLDNTSLTSETIQSIDVVHTTRAPANNGPARFGVRLSGSNTLGTSFDPSSSYVTRSNDNLARPGGGSWAVSDLNSLQVYVSLTAGCGGFGGNSCDSRATQVYVEVNYLGDSGSGLTAGDRPVLVTVGNNLHMIFQDGNLSHSVWNGSSWSTQNTTVAAVADTNYSVTTDETDVWVLATSGTTATNLYQYSSGSWSSLTDPWTSETAVEQVSITYDSTNDDLWAHIIKDSSDQAYYKTTDAGTISWSSETSYAFTAGTINEISAPMTGAGTNEVGVVVNQGSNYEASIPYEITISSSDAQFGSLQRKLVYVNSNWYAFYSDLGVIYYKKSADGSTWGSAVTIDSSGADNYNPSIWLESNTIYVAWIDDSADAVEVNTIETDNSDTLGTKCTSPDLGTIGSTFMTSVAVTDDATVYVSYSDTASDTEAGIYKLTYAGCTFTPPTIDIALDNTSSGQTGGSNFSWNHTVGSGSNQILLVQLAWEGTGTVSSATYNGVAMTQAGSATSGGTAQTIEYWYIINPTQGTNSVSFTFSSKSTSGPTKYGASSWNNVDVDGTPVGTFVSATSTGSTTASVNATSDTGEIVVDAVSFGDDDNAAPGANQSEIWIETDTANEGGSSYESGSSTTTMSWSTGDSNPWAIGALPIKPEANTSSGVGAGDRPVLTTIGNNLHVIFQDGNLSHSVYNGTSWTVENQTIAAVTDSTYSVTTDGTDIWVLSQSGTTDTNFYKYVSSSWSSDTAPWSSATNLSSPSITYESGGDDLYAFVMHDASEQAYVSITDSATISWGSEDSLGFTAGDLGELSSPSNAASQTQAQVVLRQGTNLEFSNHTYNTAPTITGGPTVGYGSFTRTGPSNTPFTVSFTATDPEESGVGELTYDIRTGSGVSGGSSLASGTFDSGVQEVVNIAYNTTGLAEGSNTIYLYITDTIDAASTNPSTTVLRDDTNPTAATLISHNPDPVSNSGTQYTVTFTPNDLLSTSTDEISYQIRTASGGLGTLLISSTGTDETPETTGTITDNTLSTGSNTRYIRQCDGANNCSDTSFTVTVNDLPQITGSPVATYGLFTRTGPNNTPFTITFTATDGQQSGADELTYYIHTAANRTGTLVGTGTFDSGVEEAPTFAYNASGLAEGSNTLYLSVYDGTDYDATNPSFTVLRDDTNPSSATLISHTPDPVSDVNNQYTVTFTPHDTTSTSSDEITYSICTSTGGSGCTLSSGTATDDIPETTGTITDASLTTGSNTRYIRQCDGANNCADTSFTVTLNSGPSITDGPDVDYGLYTRTGPNNTPFTISFTATDGQETGANELTYYIHTGANRTGTQIATGTMTSGIEKVASIAYNTAGLSSGSNTLYLSIYDGVDYSANPNFTVLRDDAAPTSATSISTNPSPVSVGSNQYKVTFTPNDTLSTSVNEIRFWICTGTGGIGCTLATGTATDEAPEQTSTIVDSLSIGSNTRYVRQCDGANNCADTSFTVTGTEAPPDIILDGNIIIDGDVEL